MSLSLSALRELVTIGLTPEQILRVAEAQAEAAEAPRQRSRGADRQARYEERKRQKASENVRTDVRNDASEDDAPLPLPPSPQTPQPPTPTRVDNTPLPPRSGSRRKPETALPDDCPSADLVAAMQAEARQAGANADMAFEARQFRDWWLSKDGRNRDWDACWRTWARKRIANAPKTALAAVQSRRAPAEDDRWRRWLREFQQNRHWPSDDAGPRPGHPACRVPPAILAEFGFAPPAANDPDLFASGAAA